MKKIFTLLTAISIGTFSFGQVVFQSNLSTWAGGDPTDFMGSTTSISSANVVEQTVGATYGTSMASLINTTATHVRFTTQNVSVVAGETYLIEMWVAGVSGMLRTGFYDVTNAAYNTYNPYQDMAIESAGNLTLLTQEVTAPAGCTSGQFIFSLHSTDPTYAGAPFYVGIMIDSVAISVTTPTPPTIVNIYDIQYTTASPADSPELGNIVTTKGVVTGVFQIGGDIDRFFIQDGDGAYNGIFIYENAYTVAVGDSVLVTGTVQEFNGLTEIGFVSNVTILNSGNTLPTPSIVTNLTVGDEAWEGVLVTLENAICTSVTDAFGEWKINDATTGPDLNVDDNLMPATYTSTLGNGYTVIGVRHFSFSENFILPRTELADIITVGWAGIEENSSISVYPNPAAEVVVINVQPSAIVRIYSMTGALVYEGTGKTTLDVSTFDAGIYQVTLTTGETSTSQKLMIK